MDCIFCKIVKKPELAEILYETETLIVFKDINPQAPTHLLVIPKIHIENLTLLTKNLWVDLLSEIKHIASKYQIPHYKIKINNGKLAGQEVPHLHLHFLSSIQI